MKISFTRKYIDPSRNEWVAAGVDVFSCGGADGMVTIYTLDHVLAYNSHFQGEELFFSHYCLRLHKNHPLAHKDCIDFTDLDGQTIIGKGRAYSCFRHGMDKYILPAGLNVKIISETADERIITELVAKNQAVNIGYDYAAVINPHPDIVMRPLTGQQEKGQPVYLVTDNHTLPTVATRKFQKFIATWLPAHHKDVINWPAP